MGVELKTYLQGAAIAVLGYAMVQPAYAGEAVVANENAGAGVLEQVQLTTEKREIGLQKTPIAISVVNTQTIEDHHDLVLAAEVAPPNPALPVGRRQADDQKTIVVAQATPAAPASAPIVVAQAETSGPEQVIVSAFKRETLLQDTPIAIAVVSTEELEKRHIQSLIDLAGGAIPSLRIATFEARQSALTVGIRGIVPFDANQTARDQGVGVYLDGVYLGRQQGLNTALLDVERIEVLRGPQGTLFGRNTEGGALSIITKAPSGVFGGRVTGGIGNFGAYNAGLHLDLPKYANVAVKIDGVLEHQNATVSNPLAGQLGWNYFNRYGGRVAARWTPVDNFTADLAYDTGVDQNTPFYSQLVNYNPLKRTVGVYDPTTNRLVAPGSAAGAPTCSTCIAPLSPLVQVHTDRQKVAEIGVPQQASLDKTNGFTSTLSYELSDALTLRSITAWRGVSTDQWDNSGGAHRTIFAPNANFSRYSLSMLEQHQFSQEFQAVGSLPELDYVFGLYYFNEHASEKAATPSSNRWNATGTGYTINSEIVFPPITSANQGWDPSSWFVQRASRAKAESYSAFGTLTWTPADFDMVHLTAGGRYTQDKRDGILFTVVNQPTNFAFKFDNNRFDPMVTLAYDATQAIHLYATYATGFRAGGANDRSQTFAAFGPEEVKSYEIGAKTDLFDNRVRLNVAGYIMDRTGTQTDFDNVDTNPTSPTFNLHTEETRNAPGTSKIRGVEAELTLRVTDELTLGASYAYTHVTIPPTPNPFLGNALFPVFVVFTPPNAASAFADYEWPLGNGGMSARFHLDANYADATYSFQAEPVKTDSSFIVNGRIGLSDIPVGSFGQTLTLSLWARNLFDETHIYRRSAANAAVLGDYANFNPPRTFGLEGTVRF
jgi:iron complex outermembrane receptor protein